MTILENKSFTGRLSDIKSIFQKTLDKTRVLKEDMRVALIDKNEQIDFILDQIKEIKAVSSEADKFISNLEKLV